ncbi:MAG: hypothetical protein LAO24_00210 [Acidobacteriia bacterium]|nr:hypothetical protein [Terriglobia bacterium]
MDRRLVPVLGLLLVASFYSVVSGPTAGRGHDSSTGGKTPEVTAKSSPKATGSRPTEEWEIIPRAELGPWQASCGFFLEQPNRSPGVPINLLRPSDPQMEDIASDRNLEEPMPERAAGTSAQWLLLRRWCTDSSYKLQVLIATVPDPVNTHLALDFDRRIEAIQWAAQDSGYLNDHFWLPWEPGPLPQYDDPDQQREQAMLNEIRLRQPGLQVFRVKQSNVALFVFLVGETPTNGINKIQLRNAIQYTDQLCGSLNPSCATQHEIRILGPTFSGSFDSLKQALGSPKYATREFRVVTPSMFPDPQSLFPRPSNVHIERVEHDTKVKLDRFLDYAKRDLDVNPWEVALLNESDTGLAAQVRSQRAVLQLRFPREISRLRNAYPDLPNPVGPQGQPLQSPNRLPLTLKDSTGNSDDVPPFSLGQLPLSQEGVLLDIAAALRLQKIKLVGIVATDVFDVLFLARFLKDACPDVRLFTVYPDVLLVRAAESIPLEGTLTITTAPLLPANHYWTSPSPRLLFPSYTALATYNAFLGITGNENHMREYAWPGTYKEDEPPLWVSVVGRNAYWPVSLLPERPGERAAPFVQASPRVNGFHYPAPSNGYLLLCAVLAMISFGHGFGEVLLKRIPYHDPLHALKIFFVVDRFGDGTAQKAFFFACARLVVVAMDFVTFLPLWLGLRDWSGAFFWFLAVVSALLTLAVLASAVHASYVCRTCTDPSSAWFGRSRNVVLLGWLLLLLVIPIWTALATSDGRDGGMSAKFFVLRSTEFSSGVSPLLPYLLLLIAFYIWCWTHILRVRFWEWRRPLLPTAALDEKRVCQLQHLQEQLTDSLGALLPQGRASRVVAIVFLASPLVLRPWRGVSSIEFSFGYLPRLISFDSLYILLVVVLWTFIALSCVRVAISWGHLRVMLRGLERLPLRRAFDLLPKEFYSGALFRQLNASSRNYSLLTRSVESLRKLVSSLPQGMGPATLPKQTAKLQGQIEDLWRAAAEQLPHDARALCQCYQGAADIANDLLDKLLLPYWDASGVSDSLDKRDEDESSKPGPNQRYVLTQEKPHDPPDYIVLAEEFVAIRFVAFIRYVSLQSINLLWFLSIAFILTVASLRSYPFLAHRAIGWTLTLAFVVLGFWIVLIFSQMERDAILSRLSNTEPGTLSRDFYVRVLSYGALPLLTVLASQFPSIGRFLFSWVQPGLEAMK